MTFTLTTKLYIPPLRPELVPRPNLLERLYAGLDRKLTLISAPAGFGKTTLLSEWGNEVLDIEGWGLAWLSLDEGDNDPVRFLAYFVRALEQIQVDVGADVLSALQAPQTPSREALLTSLVNEIAAMPGPFALVLDDYHVITEQIIHDGLTFVLNHLPPQAHIVIAGRSQPPLPLARMRARGQLLELDSDDLRFTQGQAATFLSAMLDRDLAPQDVKALTERTEGWVAGLQMAALSIQKQGDAADFMGADRYVLDYLVKEVLEQQPRVVRDFLLQTCILERLNGALCDALTGKDDGQALLERLERDNLFITPLDNRRQWYRYHQLFAQLLRQRLSQSERGLGKKILSLHRQAASWYERNDLTHDAIAHALAARDFQGATRLVEQNAVAMLQRNEMSTLLNWLGALPQDVLRARPFLCIVKAWALLAQARFDEAEQCAQDAEAALGGDTTAQTMWGHIYAIQATVSSNLADNARTIALSRQALESLPPDEALLRGVIALNLGEAFGRTNDLPAARQAYSEAIASNQEAGNIVVTLSAMNGLGGLYARQGDLYQAANIHREAVQLAEKSAPGKRPPAASGTAYISLALCFYEWNDLDAALRHARLGVECCQRWGHFLNIIYSLEMLAQVQRARGDVAGAHETLASAMQLAANMSSPVPGQQRAWVLYRLEALRARLWLGQGNIEAVARWALEHDTCDDDPHSYLVLPRLYLAQGQASEALRLLGRLLQRARSGEWTSRVLDILLLQARAYQAQGDRAPALAALRQALSLAQAGGYVRIFVDQGQAIADLRHAAAQGIQLDYVGKLLAAFASETQDKRQSLPTDALSEALSAREIEVLRLIAANLSNREIADTLFVSVNTVKSHVKRIYAKLRVHKRLEAVERAREFGLL